MSPVTPSPREVMVLADVTSSAFARGVLRGVGRYLHTGVAWNVSPTVNWDRSGHVDGLITGVLSQNFHTWLMENRVRVVVVSSSVDPRPLPAILNDNAAIGRLAAQHLIDRRLPHLACSGPAGWFLSQERLDAFEATARQAGLNCDRLEGTFAGTGLSYYQARDEEVVAWLAQLPKPVGLFVPTDNIAQSVLRICRRVGLRVPDDVAVVGVNNDELIASVSQPPLSSVAIPSDELGFAAAELLDRLMNGEPAPAEPRLMPPLGIRARQSSDVLEVPDSAVVRAYRYIHLRAGSPIHPEDVHEHVGLARRSLETRFRRHMGYTLSQAILQAHVRRARELLLDTDLPLADIAERSGFRHLENFHAAFRKLTGQTPRQFQRQHKG